MKVSTISVVIPVRNRASLIVRALESVAAQTYPAAEIIVVDDASTDETVEVVNRLAATIGNLQVLSLKDNVGAGEARNIGVRAAKGELIAFLDSDDRWYPEKLAMQVKVFDADAGVVAAFCGIDINDGEQSVFYTPPLDGARHHLFFGNVFRTMSAAVVAKAALLRIGGIDPTLASCQDWDLFIRLSEVGKIAVVPQALIEYTAHGKNRISGNKAGVISGHNVVFERICQRIEDTKLRRLVRSSHEFSFADIYSYDIFEPLSALKHAVKGFALSPGRRSLAALGGVINRLVKASTNGGVLSPKVID